MVTLRRNEGCIALIPVDSKPEPADFDQNVRIPGQHFLRRVPNPTKDDFKRKNFWKHALPHLRTAYGNVCAYSCFWVPGSCTVDHFHPKTKHPDLAYEWSNYRLAHDKMNGNKGDSTDVLDPFHIQTGWFVLDTASLWVTPEANLRDDIKTPVQRTIKILRLNDEQWVEMRFRIFTDYLRGKLPLEWLQQYYPFIASEIQRQGIQPKVEVAGS